MIIDIIVILKLSIKYYNARDFFVNQNSSHTDLL